MMKTTEASINIFIAIEKIMKCPTVSFFQIHLFISLALSRTSPNLICITCSRLSRQWKKIVEDEKCVCVILAERLEGKETMPDVVVIIVPAGNQMENHAEISKKEKEK